MKTYASWIYRSNFLKNFSKFLFFSSQTRIHISEVHNLFCRRIILIGIWDWIWFCTLLFLEIWVSICVEGPKNSWLIWRNKLVLGSDIQKFSCRDVESTAIRHSGRSVLSGHLQQCNQETLLFISVLSVIVCYLNNFCSIFTYISMIKLTSLLFLICNCYDIKMFSEIRVGEYR